MYHLLILGGKLAPAIAVLPFMLKLVRYVLLLSRLAIEVPASLALTLCQPIRRDDADVFARRLVIRAESVIGVAER